MRSNSLPNISVIKKEEKEAKLKSFIADHLARASSNQNTCDHGHNFLLIARSVESPVVRALSAALIDAGASDGAIGVRVLLLLRSGESEAVVRRTLPYAADCRMVSDMRLLDGHEQLWLDCETAWVGDCMRREPDKRDAYECYAHGCKQTAQFAETTFSHLWKRGVPVTFAVADADISAPPQLDPALVLPAATDGEGPTAATRH